MNLASQRRQGGDGHPMGALGLLPCLYAIVPQGEKLHTQNTQKAGRRRCDRSYVFKSTETVCVKLVFSKMAFKP